MTAVKLVLTVIILGSIAKADEYHPGPVVNSDASQTEILSQIDKGVLDFYPSIAAPIHWVIYPEDHARIGVALSDRKKFIDLQKLAEGEIETEFGEDPDLDEILVQ